MKTLIYIAFLALGLSVSYALFVSLPIASGKSIEPHPALEGNCPVCLVEKEATVKGKSEFQSFHDGRTFWFPGQKQKEMFDKNPEKYIPAFGGKCVVCQVETGSAGPGKAEHFTVRDDRLFLFPNEKVKGMFDRNPEKYTHVGVGMDEHCPVCLHKGKKVKGDTAYRATYDSVTYYFPSQEVKEKFLDRPERYVPALGGDCVVCKVEMGKDVPGKLAFSQVYNDRLFLFPGQKQLEMFKDNPRKYAAADLALQGFCAVCAERSNTLVSGSPEFAAVFNGMRYQFPNAQTLEAFQANPAAFGSKEVEAKVKRLLKKQEATQSSFRKTPKTCEACGG